MSSSQYCVEKFLDQAGVDRRTFTAKPSFYRGFNNLFTLGWGNDYINGNFEIEDEDLIAMFTPIFKSFSRFLQRDDYAGFRSLRFYRLYQLMNATQMFNWQFIRSRYFADKHYELPHQLYVNMLGPSRAYSSGDWPKGITTLDQSQGAKFSLVVRKPSLTSGKSVLDFGCGAGSFGQYAGQLGIRYVGLNICQEQLNYAREHNSYPDLVTYLDYNLVTQGVEGLQSLLGKDLQQFDAATFIGSIEHVGWKNYTSLYRKLYKLLKLEGEILCHTIGSYVPVPVADPFIMTKIFPDSQLAVMSEMTRATENAGFKLMDWHDLETGNHSYAKTLRCWLHNFQSTWEEGIKPFMPHKDKEAFYREWVFYLTLCIGAFESGFTNVGHYVFRKIGDNRPFTVIR